jgi:hypothetical protein
MASLLSEGYIGLQAESQGSKGRLMIGMVLGKR